MQTIKAGIGNGRLFIVGIGSAPNAHFMRSAAQTGRGTFTFIGSRNEVEQKMGELLHKLTHPVLSNIEVRWPDGAVPEYAPAQIGDLYADEPIVITARLPAKARGVLTITGRAGGVWTQQLSLDDTASSAGVATLWAHNRIADLMALQTLHVEDADIRAQVLPLALDYQLVSKYTSLIAVDTTPVRPHEASLHSKRIDNTKPNGSQRNASGLPQTANSAQLQLLIGALALLLATAMRAHTMKRAQHAHEPADAAPVHPLAGGSGTSLSHKRIAHHRHTRRAPQPRARSTDAVARHLLSLRRSGPWRTVTLCCGRRGN
jgi:Ca-activated chloride channel homolog